MSHRATTLAQGGGFAPASESALDVQSTRRSEGSMIGCAEMVAIAVTVEGSAYPIVELVGRQAEIDEKILVCRSSVWRPRQGGTD
ncbi:hypothetical protein CBI38_34805 (plasmid) [Rhodococcus oxybenzonivorans]|uniref:Uncharacterized protein n=1 Tax=Rhodococcus oxybenzonivorans TaxID=1990687 RepID=A0A2S2C6P0_9NOCA|nr:hypothetical protein CBI38_34805 [Rhodococcus oxybenzonivorans]